jgi:hypothetical protein
MSRPELADVFRRYGEAFRARHKLTLKQHNVMRLISQCRTSALGAHVDRCTTCGHHEISYNSCGDRHCPKCQGARCRQWVDRCLGRLLPTQYFHLVFTLPAELRDLIRHNKRLCYDLLMKSAAATLQAFAERRWGGRLGITVVLHTWAQNLSYHPHVHCLVSGGAFDGERWHQSPHNYLFPCKALARVYRAKFRDGLLAAKEDLALAPSMKPLVRIKGLAGWLRDEVPSQWVVYAKAPFARPENVVRYIGRYTHRVAISNRRLLGIDSGKIRFLWRDYRDGKRKEMTLSSDEFIRRFLQHVLPQGFVRIRHYGLHARRCELPDAEEPISRSCPACTGGVLVFHCRIELWQWPDAKDPPKQRREVACV